jgi:hypothetical protein
MGTIYSNGATNEQTQETQPVQSNAPLNSQVIPEIPEIQVVPQIQVVPNIQDIPENLHREAIQDMLENLDTETEDITESDIESDSVTPVGSTGDSAVQQVFNPLNLTIDCIFSNKPQTVNFMWLYSRFSVYNSNKMEWAFMPQDISTNLETAYQEHRNTYQDAALYTHLDFNFSQMIQLNQLTGFQRHIIRVSMDDMLKTKADYINYLLQNENQYALKTANNYKLYQPYIQQMLFTLNNTDTNVKKLNIVHSNCYYMIDLVANTQTNLRTGKVRNIELINVNETNNVDNSFNY